MRSFSSLPGASSTDEERAANENVLERFETAWRQGAAPAIDDYLAGSHDDLPRGLGGDDGARKARRALLVELVHLDLEFRLNAGEEQRVEGYLSRYPELAEDRSIVRDLIVAEYRLRQRRERDLGSAEYLRRFPQFGAALAEWLASSTESIQAEATVPQLPPAAEPWPNDLPGYRVVGELGRGGMGIVYKAVQLNLNRIVGLKMIRAGADAGPDLLARFQVEAEALAGLHHPNIVQVHEVGRHRGCPYMALEFLEGGSLHDLLHGRPQPARSAAEMVETLARAMHCAHLRGIVHRDLKPANILLQAKHENRNSKSENGSFSGVSDFGIRSSDLTPKITDFGLAKRLQEDQRRTVTGMIMGTPNYMAPEQAEGRSDKVGPLADVYALGAILYEMLTGRPPFEGDTQLETVRKVLSEEPTPPRLLQPTVPRDLSTLCLKCLEKDPRRRFTSAEALADELRRFLNGEPILARSAGRAERAWKWIKRRPAQAALVGVIIVAVGALVGTFWISYRRVSRAYEEAKESATVAFHAVDELYTRTAEERLLDEPNKDPMREVLLARAPALYERLARQQSADPAVRRRTALAWFRLGDLHRVLDKVDLAAEEFLQAIERQEALCRGDPRNGTYLYEQAESHIWLGELLRENQQRLLDAEPHFREALDCQQRALHLLPEDAPESRKARLGVARSHYSLGIVAMDTGRPDGARAEYDLAVGMLSTLHLAAPDDANCRQDLARALADRGVLNKENNRPADAQRDYEAAREHLAALVRQFPSRVTYKYEFAIVQQNLGTLLASMGSVPEAQAALHEAFDLLKKLTTDFSTRPRYKKKLANTLNSQGIALDRSGDRAGAEQCWIEASDLLEPLAKDPSAAPDYKALLGIALGNLGWLKTKEENWLAARPLIEAALVQLQAGSSPQLKRKDYESALRNNTQTLAETLVQLGDHASAVAAAEELASLSPEEPLNSYYAACYIARSIPHALNDEKLGGAGAREAVAQKYAARAVHALLQTAGRITDGMPRLKDEAALLRPLEHRPGFVDALRALDAKTKKPNDENRPGTDSSS
jgi:tetratricopeptide (TPR) repeat protein